MKVTQAVILAAGRGSRMKARTEERPKCLLELAGNPLLYWQMKALRAAGILDILVVRGYLSHTLSPSTLPWAGNFTVTENPRWQETNMLSTLRCADAQVRAAFAAGTDRVIISYADIVYPPEHVRALAACTHDICITYDEMWEDLWRLRFGDPLLDAETFRQEGGILQEIGGKPQCLTDIHGQYMGLLSFSVYGWDALCAICDGLEERLDKTDMTSFLREVLARQLPVGTVPVQGRWCEADNGNDLDIYKQALAKGQWPHDWREDIGERI